MVLPACTFTYPILNYFLQPAETVPRGEVWSTSEKIPPKFPRLVGYQTFESRVLCMWVTVEDPLCQSSLMPIEETIVSPKKHGGDGNIKILIIMLREILKFWSHEITGKLRGGQKLLLVSFLSMSLAQISGRSGGSIFPNPQANRKNLLWTHYKRATKGKENELLEEKIK